MKYYASQGFNQLLIIGAFFFELFHVTIHGVEKKVTGFDAIISPGFYVIGNILIASILLISLVHFALMVYGIIGQAFSDRLKAFIVGLVNIELIIAIIVVTFLGTFLEVSGMLMIGLIVLSTFLKYKQDKIG